MTREIPVLCLRGHRIGIATVRDDGDGLRIDQWVKGLRGVWEDVYQADPASGRTLHKVRIDCGHRNCGYKGRFDYSTFIAGVIRTAQLLETASATGEINRIAAELDVATQIDEIGE